MLKKYEVFNVFTPTTTAKLTFVERESINDKIVNALRTPGKQVIVYGHSGSGKTTLLINKLHQLYENHITTRCMKDMLFEELVLDAFDQISAYYISEKKSSINSTISAELESNYSLIKSKLNVINKQEEHSTQTRILPPQLTPQTLARFIGATGCCWVLEDFHKMPKEERTKLSQIMKIFKDMADEYRTLKIIAIGAVDTARQIVEYDSEMKTRVAEIEVPLMEKTELMQIIKKGMKLLNIKIKKDMMENISSFSNGLASVCHSLCLNICITENIYETNDNIVIIQEETLQKALNIYLEESSDSVKKVFDIALKQKRVQKFNNAKLIIKALAMLNQEGAQKNEIFKKIKEFEPKYPQGNINRFLTQLSSGENSILRFDSNSGKYFFKDPIYKVYALALFKDLYKKTSINKYKTNKEISSVITEQLIKNIRKIIEVSNKTLEDE